MTDESARSSVASTTGRPLVRAAHSSDQSAIDDVIGRAFFDDPIARYIFPRVESRRECFGAFARLAMNQFAGAGATFVTDPVRGAAIWQAPSPQPLPVGRQLAMAVRLFWIVGRAYPRVIRLIEAMEEARFRGPHWYLATLGTDPDFQGRGLGSALLGPILSRCDEEGLTAYLESSKESNIPFYSRHGFDIAGEIQLADGPKIWPMIRPPR